MNTAEFTFVSPAKINLFLHILGRREDGYHNLQTVFQFIDLCDEITIQVKNETTINRLSQHDYSAESDLAIRAARALQLYTKVSSGANISIDKYIPAGGGLGGGSSNAATVLLALNVLWQCGLDKSALMQIGGQLGADVPIFIHGASAWAEGVGEQITTIATPEDTYLLIVPAVHVSTAEVFSHSGLTRNTQAIKIRDLYRRADYADCRNDCEALVRQMFPEINLLMDALTHYGDVKMTGTGATLFIPYNDKQTAQNAKAAIAKELSDVTLHVVQSRALSPLHEQLDKKEFIGV